MSWKYFVLSKQKSITKQIFTLMSYMTWEHQIFTLQMLKPAIWLPFFARNHWTTDSTESISWLIVWPLIKHVLTCFQISAQQTSWRALAPWGTMRKRTKPTIIPAELTHSEAPWHHLISQPKLTGHQRHQQHSLRRNHNWFSRKADKLKQRVEELHWVEWV